MAEKAGKAVKGLIDKIHGNGSYDFADNQKRKNPAVRAYENTPGFKDAKEAKKARQERIAARKKAAGIHNGKGGADASGEGGSGVILDLSGKAAGKKQEADAGTVKRPSLAAIIRRLAVPVVRWLKDFWGSGPSQESAKASGLEQPQIQPGESMAGGEGEAEDAGLSFAKDAGLPPLDELGGFDGADRFAGFDGADRFAGFDGADSWGALDASGGLGETAAHKPRTGQAEAVKSYSLRQIEQLVTQNGTKRLAHNSDLLTYYDRRGKFVEMDETQKHRVLFGDKHVLKL